MTPAEQDTTQQDEFVTGDSIEPDESRTPQEFANDEWLTLDQVAHRMGVSATQVREWVDGGQLTPQAFGSIEKVKRSEIDRIGNPDDGAAQEFEKDHSS